MKSIRLQLAVTALAIAACVVAFAHRGLPPEWHLLKYFDWPDLQAAASMRPGILWGARLPRTSMWRDMTPLHAAVSRPSSRETVAALLACGIDPEIRCPKDATPLHWMACTKYPKTKPVDTVLEAINRRFGRPMPPEDRDAPSPQAEALRAAQLLLDHGADIEARMPDGRTPLHLAAEFGIPRMVAFLLAHGADRTARDDRGRTPLEVARAAGRDDVVRLLEAADGATH